MPAATPHYSFPYPLSTDPPNVPSDMQSLATAVDTSLAAEAAARAALPLGRKGSGIDTGDVSGVTGTEVLVGTCHTTFTAVAGRRYRVSITGSINCQSGGIVGLRVRWAAGSSVTTAGTDVYELQGGAPAGGAGDSVTISGFTEVTGITAGQVTFGVFAINLAGSGNQNGNGALQPTVILVDDVGV